MRLSPILRLEEVTKRFGGVVALDRVSFSVDRGSIFGLIGPNGAGKTTLFNCVTGLLRPEEGSVHFGSNGERLERLLSHQIAELGVARTFQNIRLFANLSVLQNVIAGTYIRTKAGLIDALWPFRKGPTQEEHWAIDRAERLLEELGLIPFRDQRASSLSYGQQRRLELARALASEPELLLLDEPAAGLSYEERQELIGFLRNLKAKGLTILLIEHDMRVAMSLCDWIVVLDEGEKIAEGPPKEIQEDPAVIEAYLGVIKETQ